MPWSSIDKGNKCSYNDFIALGALILTQPHMALWTVWLPLGCSDTYGDGKIMKYEVGQAAYILKIIILPVK